jgi:hypothetical protein
VCVATANSAQQGFDRAEARLNAIETDFQRSASELTREIQTVVAEIRALSPLPQRQLAGEMPSWPLEDVTRLHHHLRETDRRDPRAVRALPEASSIADAQRPFGFERASAADESNGSLFVGTPVAKRLAQAAVVTGIVLLLAAGDVRLATRT